MNSMISIVRETNDTFSDMISALDASFAVVEFDLQGNVLSANESFLSLTGYREDELVGQPQSILLPDGEESSLEHSMCWADLKAGSFKRAVLPRITKSGKRIWIEATYTPVRNGHGDVVKIVKIATDVTAAQKKMFDLQGKVDAIEHSHVVIEFDLRGNVLRANHHFLSSMGYEENEIIGRHHSMFVDPDYAKSTDYRAFWRALAKGHHSSRQLKRIAKDGRDIWFEATYNPVFDPDGGVCKVVKFAVDVTDQVTALIDLKSILEASFDDIDQNITTFDRNKGDVVASCGKAMAHLETSTMIGSHLTSSVDETMIRMVEFRSVADHVFETAIEGDVAAVALKQAIDALRNEMKDFPAVTQQIDFLEERVDASTRISSTLRSELTEMLSRVAIVSLAVKKQSEITAMVTGEMHGVQTSLEAAQGGLASMQQTAEQLAVVAGTIREAAAFLAR